MSGQQNAVAVAGDGNHCGGGGGGGDDVVVGAGSPFA